jgi:hypothetical protein
MISPRRRILWILMWVAVFLLKRGIMRNSFKNINNYSKEVYGKAFSPKAPQEKTFDAMRKEVNEKVFPPKAPQEKTFDAVRDVATQQKTQTRKWAVGRTWRRRGGVVGRSFADQVANARQTTPLMRSRRPIPSQRMGQRRSFPTMAGTMRAASAERKSGAPFAPGQSATSSWASSSATGPLGVDNPWVENPWENKPMEDSNPSENFNSSDNNNGKKRKFLDFNLYGNDNM